MTRPPGACADGAPQDVCAYWRVAQAGTAHHSLQQAIRRVLENALQQQGWKKLRFFEPLA
jgi:hypothetical protein